MSQTPGLRFFPALLVLSVAGCRPDAADKPSWSADTVAVVGKVPLYQKDLDHALSLAGNRGPEDTLKELAHEEALAQLALAEGVAEDPSVRAAVRRLLAARLREKHATTVTVSPEALADALAQLRADAPPAPPQFHVAFLRQRFSTAGSEAAAVAAMEQARADFLALPPDPSRRGFGTLAATVSDDTDTRYQGGDGGWISQGKSHVLLPGDVSTALTALTKPGMLPEVIRAADAAWLGMVTLIKTPEAPKIDPRQVEARLLGEGEARQASELLVRALTASPLTILKPPVPARPAPVLPVPPMPPG